MKKLKRNYYNDIIPHTIKDVEIMITIIYLFIRDLKLTEKQFKDIPEKFKKYFE